MAKLYIVMATYNGEKYLSQMLDSLVAQTRPADKIIVVDDGSKDNSVRILESYKEKLPLEITVFPQNQGHRAAFSKSLEIAQATCDKDDYIALADQDDIWLPQKHEILIQEIEKKNADGNFYDLVFGDAQVIDGEGKVFAQSWRAIGGIPESLSTRALMTGFTNVTGCMVLFRASLLKSILPIPEDVPVHDQWIAFCASVRGGNKSIKQPVIQYRIHNQNAIGLGHNHTWTGNLKLNLKWAKMLLETPHVKALPASDQEFLKRYIKYIEKRLTHFLLPSYIFWITKNARSLYPHVQKILPLLPRILFGIVGARLARLLGKS